MKTNKRILVSLVIAAILIAPAIIRLIDVQLFRHEDYLKIRDSQIKIIKELRAERGRIYDRNNYVLAENINSISIFADPTKIDNADQASIRLSKIIGKSKDEIFELIQKPQKPLTFKWIKRQNDYRIKKAIEDASIRGIYTIEEPKRFYPEKESACHILGFAGVDTQGLAGVEYIYDSRMKGANGVARYFLDGRRQTLNSFTHILSPAKNGEKIRLTIDIQLQKSIEQEQSRFGARYSLPASSVIIFEQKSGQVYVLADNPFYDPNKYSEYIRKIPFPVMSITELFVIRPLVYVLMAIKYAEELSENAAEFSKVEEVICRKYSQTNSADENKMKIMVNHFQESGLKQLFNSYGIGRKCGAPILGEDPGENNLDHLGQGVQLTPIQIAKVIAIVVNDGGIVSPVFTIENGENRVEQANNKPPSSKILLSGTSRIIRNALIRNVTQGNAREVGISGYEIGAFAVPLEKNISRVCESYGVFGYFNEMSSKKNFVFCCIIKKPQVPIGTGMTVAKEFARSVILQAIRYFEINAINKELE